ncbi:MAG: nicotinate (nicotinamide) nucleotide adenylyltransferase [Planctomycetota bacterium]
MRSGVGWLGGSFDPPHEGHLHVARGVVEALNLERLLLIPAARPPHKLDRVLASSADRLALLHLACAGQPRLVVDDRELQRHGPSYSVDTARELVAAWPAGTELFLVLGTDLLPDLASWHRIGELLSLVTLCPVARPGQAVDWDPLLSRLPAAERSRLKHRAVRLPLHPASSTEIRQALQAGREPPFLAPAVRHEITRRGLYRPT